MKIANKFRDESLDELQAMYVEKRKKLFKLVNELKHERKLEKPHLIRQTRREIACLLTVIGQKQAANAVSGE